MIDSLSDIAESVKCITVQRTDEYTVRSLPGTMRSNYMWVNNLPVKPT